MKTIADKDLGMDCNFIARGETENEAIDKLKEHMETAHSEEMEKITSGKSEDQIKKEFRKYVKEE